MFIFWSLSWCPLPLNTPWYIIIYFVKTNIDFTISVDIVNNYNIHYARSNTFLLYFGYTRYKIRILGMKPIVKTYYTVYKKTMYMTVSCTNVYCKKYIKVSKVMKWMYWNNLDLNKQLNCLSILIISLITQDLYINIIQISALLKFVKRVLKAKIDFLINDSNLIYC